MKGQRRFSDNMTIEIRLNGWCCSGVCGATGFVTSCRRSDMARAFPYLFRALHELRYHALGFNKTIYRMWSTDMLSNHDANGSLPSRPHNGARRPRLPPTAGHTMYGHLCYDGTCFSLMLPGFLLALRCLYAVLFCRSLPAWGECCLGFLRPCVLLPEILTYPQYGARRSIPTRLMTQPQSERIYDRTTPTTSPIIMFSVDLHQLYPGDCCRNALHPDPFGSDFNGHVLWNVPDLPYGMRPSKHGRRCWGERSRRVRARYGLRARRIGEAQHPGPALVATKCLKIGNQTTKANRATPMLGAAPTATGSFHKGGNLSTGTNWTTLVTASDHIAFGNDNEHLTATSPADVATPSPSPEVTQIDDVEMTPTPASTPTALGCAIPIIETPSLAKRCKIDDANASADEPMTQDCDNGYLMAAGPASAMPGIPPPPSPPTPLSSQNTPD